MSSAFVSQLVVNLVGGLFALWIFLMLAYAFYSLHQAK